MSGSPYSAVDFTSCPTFSPINYTCSPCSLILIFASIPYGKSKSTLYPEYVTTRLVSFHDFEFLGKPSTTALTNWEAATVWVFTSDFWLPDSITSCLYRFSLYDGELHESRISLCHTCTLHFWRFYRLRWHVYRTFCHETVWTECWKDFYLFLACFYSRFKTNVFCDCFKPI